MSGMGWIKDGGVGRTAGGAAQQSNLCKSRDFSHSKRPGRGALWLPFKTAFPRNAKAVQTQDVSLPLTRLGRSVTAKMGNASLCGGK